MKTTSVNFNKMFYAEVREKKRTGANIFKRKGKRGYVGRLYTTVDLLKGKEKREYKKSGKVVELNVYKQLIPLEELRTYSLDKQKQIIEEWKKRHTQKEIIAGLGIGKNLYYKIQYDLGILERPKSKKKNAENNYKTPTDIIPYEDFKLFSVVDRLQYLDDLFERYNAKEIGLAWDKKDGNVYQLRSNLRKKVRELEEEKASENDVSVAISDTPVPKQESLALVEEEKEEVQEAPRVEITEEEENAIERVIAHMTKQDEVIKAQQSHMEEMRAHIQAMDDYYRNQLEVAATSPTMEMENTKSEFVPPVEKVQEVKEMGMTFTYQDVKQGFLLHNDIKQFISMLEKNPNEFQISIEMKRLEDEG